MNELTEQDYNLLKILLDDNISNLQSILNESNLDGIAFSVLNEEVIKRIRLQEKIQNILNTF